MGMLSLKQGLPHAVACLGKTFTAVFCAEALPGVDPMTGIAYYTPGTQFAKGTSCFAGALLGNSFKEHMSSASFELAASPEEPKQCRNQTAAGSMRP